MLTIISGRARSLKTMRIMSEIKERVDVKIGGNYLLVPEQYSHLMARSLSAFCGDSLSLYGEVVTFSLLADRVFAETGGLSETVLDEGGRLLVMSLAFLSVQPSLKLYGGVAAKSDFLSGLLKAVDELKSCCISPDELAAAALPVGTLRDKLHDLRLISASFDAILENSMQDPTQRLKKLAAQIGKSTVGRGGHIYIDGFSDFTALEINIIREFLIKDADITVTLPGGEEEVFSIAEGTKRRLIRLADSLNTEYKTIMLESQSGVMAPELEHIEAKLFSTDKTPFYGECQAVKIIAADTTESECAIAASELMRFVRDEGYRWRELAVTARGFENYESTLENVFSKHGIPLFLNRKADILQKPIVSLITSALDVLTQGWDIKSMFRYLKTGLAGVTPDECDLLENYVLKWNIRGFKFWNREEAWTLSPRGYVSEITETDKTALAELDRIRRLAAAPLKRFSEALSKTGTAEGLIKALYSFVEDIKLPERLTEKAELFSLSGREKTAAEYAQLWEILIKVMEQTAAILGDMPMEIDEFSRLFKLVLSSYGVATIPVTLDAVAAGDMTRMRSGDIKCLIVIGATDDALPMVGEGAGVITDTERETLNELGFELTGGAEERILREYLTMYMSITKPTEKLMLTYPKNSGSAKKRPSYILGRIEALLNIKTIDESELNESFLISAAAPCFELAVSGSDTPFAKAARLFLMRDAEKKAQIERVLKAAGASRGALSQTSVGSVYGKKLRLSASRIDRFYSCKFSYFLQYGLKAEPRKDASFDAPEMGSFLHYVLENVVSELANKGPLKDAEKSDYRKLAELYIGKYVNERLGGIEEKSGRFKYLFDRLVKDVYTIIDDMVDELKRSDFTPLSFELEFGSEKVPPAKLEGGGMEISVGGIVDRVDGWLKDGKLYLRVVDYKTGKKSFDLSDIWYGLGMQMLIYLFTLEKGGAELYGHEVIPAGVLYAPAKDVYMSLPRSATEEEIRAERSKSLMRSGILINDPEVIDAMEKGEKKFLPVKFSKDGQLKSDNLATLEQLGKLGAHIKKTLANIGDEMKKGNISADPYKKSNQSPCDYCEYFSACHFDEKKDRRRYLKRLKADEVWEAVEGGECK